MNILFISNDNIPLEYTDIYGDIINRLEEDGHNITIIIPSEKNEIKQVENKSINKIFVNTGNLTQCGFIKKGITTLLISSKYIKALKKYCSDIKFDLVIYPTPPVTFAKVVKFIKRRDNAKAYLLLKDIFPQNALDLGILSKKGIKSFIYHYFRKIEKSMYNLADKIGCMSPANKQYLLKNNPYLDENKIELFPNSINPIDISISHKEKELLRKEYNLPIDKKIFIYGGNLGKPQGVDFIINSLKCINNINDAFFLIIGNGTEYEKIKNFIDKSKQFNVRLLKGLPKDEYDKILRCCDIGLIYLDSKFTIPNFPSRLITYMQAHLPVLSATDINTDVGKIIEDNGFGLSCTSDNVDQFRKCVLELLDSDLRTLGNNAYYYLEENFNVNKEYSKLLNIVK